jgi:NTP pyrophosphatase (non-canonical NTP hydrolase)
MLHMDKTLSPPTKPPRVSVPVTEEVLQVFQRLAAASGMSTGKAMAEWLTDTVEAAEYMAATLERARAAPKVVMREMHAYVLGLADETGELMRQIAKKGEAGRASERASGAPHARLGGIPPSCNTGGKLPKPQPQNTESLQDLMASAKAKGQAKMGAKVPRKGAK